MDTSGVPHFIDHPTALGALVEAANRSGFTYNISSSAYGLYVTDINGDSWVQYRVNYTSPWDSVDQYSLTGGEYVLFATGQYYPFYPLELVAPSSTRSPFNVSVLYFNDTVSTWLPLAGATVFVDGAPAGTTDANGNLSLALASGTYALRAEKAGYIRSEIRNVSVDVTPPTVSISSPVEGAYYATYNISLNATISEVAQVWYSINGVNSTPVETDVLAEPLSLYEDGNYTITVYARDAAGNVGYDTVNFTVDTHPPVVTILSPVDGSLTRFSTVALSVSVNELATIWYQVDGGANSTPVNGTSIAVPISGLSEGAHSITVYARDRAGNLNSTSVGFTVDTTPPAITITSPTATTYSTSTVPLSASLNENGMMWYRLDGGANSTPVSAPLNTNLTGLTDGTYVLYVYANDAAGNFNSTSVTFNVSLPKPNLVSSLEVQQVVSATGPSSVTSGTTLRLNANITNNGQGTAPASHAGFLVNGAKLADRPVPALAPGESHTVSFTWVPISTGAYNITSMADSLNELVETNESDNADTHSMSVTGVPDLVAQSVSVPYRIPLNTATTVNATVRCEHASVNNVLVGLYERRYISGVGYRYVQVATTTIASMTAGDTRTVSFSYTPASAGTKYLRVAVDPDDAISETTNANNNITRYVYATYSDLRTYVYAPSSAALNMPTSIRATVRNYGGLPAGNETLTVYVDDGSTNTTLLSTTVAALGAWRSRTYSISWTPSAPGTYTLTAVVSHSNTTDPYPANNVYTRTIRVREYSIDAWYMIYPTYGVYEGRYFRVGARLNTTAPGYVNATLTVDPASGITVYHATKRAYTRGSPYDTVYWLCKGDVAGLYNMTMTFEAYGKSATISTTDAQWNVSPYGTRYSPHGPVQIIVQTVEVKDDNSTTLQNTQSKNMTYQVFNVTTFDQSGKIDIIAGGLQRMLTGLTYLRGYPHGCVEQTASPLIAALRIAEYYDNYGYLDAANNSSLNSTVARGVQRLQYGALKPKANGAWSMWGGPYSPDSVYFTTYALYALSSVRMSTVNYSTIGTVSVNDTLLDKGAMWLVSQQNADGSWTGRGSDYLRSNNTMTAWVLRSLMQCVPYADATNQSAINTSISKGFAYLLSTQNSDGGWGDKPTGSTAYTQSNAYTTGLVLYLLATSNNNTNWVNNTTQVQNAITNATAWLVAHQLSSDVSRYAKKGSFYPVSRDVAGHSYSRVGVYTEATAYALLGLNATGLDSSNTTIADGRKYLYGIYQSDGSWGYTKSSAVVINALTKTIIPGGTIDLNITVGIDGTNVTTVHLTNTNPKATIPLWGERTNSSSPLGAGNHTVTVYQTGTGTSLVGVSVSQTVPKREAIASVPAEFIDPLADEFFLNITYHDATTANASLAPAIPDTVVNEKVRVNATITNINTTDNIVTLVLEVPIPTNATFTNETIVWFTNTSYSGVANYMYNSTTRMLYIYPEVVNASERASYYFNLTYNAAGMQSLTNVKVAPMYNPSLIAENNSSIYVKGYDDVTFRLVNESASAVSATLRWNESGVQSGTGTITNTTLEGDYALNFTSAGYLPVLSRISVVPGQLANYTATFYTTMDEPQAVFFENNSSTRTLPATFTNDSGWMYYNTTLTTTGGVVTVAMEKPAGNDVVFVDAQLNNTSVSPIWYNDTSSVLYLEGAVGGDSYVNITFRDIGTPVVSITSPTAGVYNISTIDLSATSNESSDMWYTINGNTGTVVNSTTTYSTTLSLSEGVNNITVYARDMGGNVGTATVNVTVDTVAPVITVNSPTTTTYGSTSVPLSVSTNEPASIWYNYNGTNSTPVSGTSLNATMTGLTDGTHTVYVYAKDTANNLNVTSVTFTVDTQGPSITITKPVANGRYNGTIWIEAYANDSVSQMWYNIDGGTNSTPVSAPLSTTVSGLSQGTHTLNVYAKDSVGNVETRNVSFIVDTTPPTVSITTPAEGQTTNSSVVLSATANENADFYYSVDNGSWTQFGTSTTSAQTTLALTGGAHTVVVRAYDIMTEGTGNMGSATVNFTVDATGPTITIHSPAPTTYTTSTVELNVTVGESATIWYRVDNGANSTPVSGTSLVTTLTLSRGQHTVYVYARDGLYNLNSASVTFTVSLPSAGGGAGARPDIYGTPAPTPTPTPTATATPVVTPVIQPVEERKVLSSVSPEAPAVVEFMQTEVTKIELDVNTPAENVEVVVEQSAEPPAGVPDVVLSIAATQPELASSMGVYGYISIDTTLPEGTVDKAKVEFKIPRSWFVDNGLDPATTALQHYNEASGQWEALPTDQTGEDDEYYYFSAETPGFSVFSVVAQKAVVATPTPTPTPTETGIPGFEAILAIGALLAIVYLVGRRTR
ncbi:CARDB domain-containing protein [Methermicoccus shengliensis]|uniref:CARDB domain-containing protein n=1 Tax=Methermicoccus shengliensis TaxID=660064 RepID=UPI001B80018B|nr:CARDB domain-containing protein [Methermicoccus shengliensis]